MMRHYRNIGIAFVGAALLFAAAPLWAAPKNVILMIGDGMGFNHVLATSLYEYGESGHQPYEQSGFTQLAASTFPAGGSYDPVKAWEDPEYLKKGYTDSAASATALSTGFKTKNAMLGLGPDQERLETMGDFAQSLGKASGVVSTVPFSHATPAAFCVHKVSRNDYNEIAHEMIVECPLQVIMAAGNPNYVEAGTRRPETDMEKGCHFLGSKDLWDLLKDPAKGHWRLIQERADFQALAQGDGAVGRVFGLPHAFSTLQQGRTGKDDDEADDLPGETPRLDDVPTLAEMSQGALQVLAADPDGFFLMIEGGAIDWTGHGRQMGRMIEETMDFNAATAAVIAWIETHGGWEQNLLIVTADHETGGITGLDGQREPQGQGKGKMPRAEWGVKGHTNALVPLYTRGDGAAALKARATGVDPVRGPYLDNTDVPKVIHALWKP